MKKIFTGFFLLFALVFFISAKTAYSQSATPTPVSKSTLGMEWHCLESARTGGHTATLTTKAGDLPKANEKTYVLVCIATELGNVCTTGSSQLDSQILGYDGLAKLNQSKSTGGYEVTEFSYNGQSVPKDKIVANSQGKLTAPIGASTQIVEPITWTDHSTKGVGRKWLALNFVETQKIEMGTGGQQQGTFTFEGALSNCVKIAWDPYGIVFDSQSLEPVPGVSLSILEKRADSSFTLVSGNEVPSLLNPVYTEEDGAFTFFVPDGTYRLKAVSANFIFPNDPNKLNSNYQKVYSDIYRGEDIVQTGGVAEHRDIPIDSKGTPYTAPVKLMSYFPFLDKGTDTLIIQGRVTHPLTIINVYGKSGETRTRLLTTTQANNLGQFQINYDLTQLNPGEYVGDIELVKVNYATLQPLQNANNPVFSLEPIFNYVEGVAYDAKGNPIANGTVGIYLNLSNKSSYDTTTDNSGYFKVSSEFLPPFSYGLKYTTAAGAVIATTTSKFLAQNQTYLEKNKINLYAFTSKSGQTFQPKKGPVSQVTLTPTQKPNVLASNTTLVIIAIIAFLVILGTVLSIAYLRKRQMPPIPPMTP